MPDYRVPLRRTLLVASVLALSFAVLMLPTVAALLTGNAKRGYMFEYAVRIPDWLRFSMVRQIGLELLVIGGLAALVIVAGRWPARVFAGLVLAWILYSHVALAPWGYWLSWISARGDLTPLSWFITGDAAAFIGLGIVGIVTSVRLSRPVEQAHPADGQTVD